MVDKDKINDCFLEAIRRLKAEGYKQKDIVEAAGLSQNAISKIKTGQNNAGDDTISKLCAAFKLNPDFFYRGSQQFTIEEKTSQQPIQPNVDFSSYINALLAKSDETIASLKRELATKNEIIQAKDDRIADLEKLAEERLHRIAELRRVIDANNMMDYPFTIGSAEPGIEKDSVRV